MIHRYKYLIVSNLSEKPFLNITLDGIEKLLHLLGGSLLDDRDKHTCIDSEKNYTSQSKVEI